MTGRPAEQGAVTVLFVGGMPRSGSTLFDLMVGQLPGHCDVGELFYLWQAGPLRDQLCACGEPFSELPLLDGRRRAGLRWLVDARGG